MAKQKEAPPPDSKWLVYVASFPAADPAARMRVLRTLESMGSAVLREGVYLLPDNQENRQGLLRLYEHVTRINGTAHVLKVTDFDTRQGQMFRSLFDRTGKYEGLIKSVEGLRAGFGISEPSAIARVLNKQRREFESISALDFFESPVREQAEQVLRDTELEVRKRMFPEVTKSGRISLSGRDYLNRVWATRKPLWADRLASAWLIRRFIDPEATLMWLDKTQECPSEAVGFGFEGASFSNIRDKVTFQELLRSFSLDKNETLTRIGLLVHSLDTGSAPIAEAAGVETLLQGARRRSSNEEELFLECEKTFDLLYEAYLEMPAKGTASR